MAKYEGAFRIFERMRWPGGTHPQREYFFHFKRRWRFDFAWPDLKIAVEADGGIFGQGPPCPVCGRRGTAGHSRVNNILRDMEKLNEAQALGWIVLRFPVDRLLTKENISLTIRVLEARIQSHKEQP